MYAVLSSATGVVASGREPVKSHRMLDRAQMPRTQAWMWRRLAGRGRGVGWLLCALWLVAAPAGAETRTAPVYPTITGPELRGLVSDLGYQARLIDTADGTPLIQTAIDGIAFSVFLYDCRAGVPMECGGFGFSAGFTRSALGNADRLSQWNRQRRFGVAFHDDQGVYLSMNVNIEGGVTRANIEDTVQLWEQALLDFATFIGWR